VEIRRHLTYANVAATLALVGVIGGGGAYAAGLIDSGDIANNSIKSKDLKNREAVTARDVKRNGITGREVQESKLKAAEFAPLSGDQDAACNPSGAEFEPCVTTNLQLRDKSRVLVVATGDFFGDGSARLSCRILVEGNAGNPVSPSDPDALDALHTEGFATTHVTGRLARGSHTASLECSEPEADGALASSSIAVLGITG
jgi:hypothetical protein